MGSRTYPQAPGNAGGTRSNPRDPDWANVSVPGPHQGDSHMETGTIYHQATAADLAHRITSITRAENAGWVDTRVCTLSGIGWMRVAIEAPAVPFDERSTDAASVYLSLDTYRDLVAASERARDWIGALEIGAGR